MRARSLKPEFFFDKKIGALGPIAALVYQALWCLADDGGVAQCEPEVIKGQMFVWWPAVGVAEITEGLRQLCLSGRIRLHQGGDSFYAEIVSWKRHNGRIHMPSKFRNAEQHNDFHAIQWEDFVSPAAALPQPSPPVHQYTSTPVHPSLGASGDAPTQSDGVPADFAACWAIYPRRPNDSRKKALKAWQARVRSGVEPTTLLEGAERYARYCDLTGKTGSEFVKQAATFLGPDEHYLLPWEPEAAAVRPTGAGPATSEADDLLAAMEGAGLVVAYSGPREVYRARITSLAEQMGQPLEQVRALVDRVKPWDLARITFQPDRRREFARRLAAASAKVAA